MAVAVAPAEVGFSAAEVGLIFGFLFLWAAILVLDAIHPPVANLAGAVPLVGGALRSAVDSSFGAIRGWLYSNLSASLVAYGNLLGWLQGAWAALVAITGGLAELTVTAVYRITTVIIPAEIGQAAAYAQALAAGAETRAVAFATAGLEHEAAALIATAEGLRGLVASAETDALRLFTTAEADIITEGARVEAAAVQLAAGERAFAMQLVGSVEAELEARVADVERIRAAAEAAILGDIGTLAGDLGRELSAGVSALEQEIAKARTLIQTGALSIAIVAADVAAIKALRCIQQCGILSNLADDIQGVEELGLLVFLESLAHDPKGAQAAIVGLLGPLAKDTAASVRAGLGA